MKITKPALPSEDKRWKIVDAKMRRYGYQPHALIETLHAVQQSFGYLELDALKFVAQALQIIALLGGKRIHSAWVVPGGVSEPLSAEKREK